MGDEDENLPVGQLDLAKGEKQGSITPGIPTYTQNYDPAMNL